MKRVTEFSFRVSTDERRAIAILAEQLRRSQSDAVRFVIVEMARQLLQAQALPAQGTAQETKFLDEAQSEPA